MQVNRLFISVLPLKIQIMLLIYEEINILMLKYLIKKMDIAKETSGKLVYQTAFSF
jgi:hypothetical protein